MCVFIAYITTWVHHHLQQSKNNSNSSKYSENVLKHWLQLRNTFLFGGELNWLIILIQLKFTRSYIYLLCSIHCYTNGPKFKHKRFFDYTVTQLVLIKYIYMLAVMCMPNKMVASMNGTFFLEKLQSISIIIWIIEPYIYHVYVSLILQSDWSVTGAWFMYYLANTYYTPANTYYTCEFSDVIKWCRLFDAE